MSIETKSNYEFLKNKQSQYIKSYPYMEQLIIKLESIVPSIVCPSFDTENIVKKLLLRGFIDKRPVKLKIGYPNNCHQNTIDLLLKGKISCIVSGYVLSDYMWVQHTWGISKNTKNIVETTCKRDIYFGYILNLDDIRENFVKPGVE